MAQYAKKKRIPKPFKYEMEKRKEQWKALNGPLEKLLTIPPEEQAEEVGELVSVACFTRLAEMLGLPQTQLSREEGSSSADTEIPFIPPDEDSFTAEAKKSLHRPSRKSTRLGSVASDSGSSSEWQADSDEEVSTTGTPSIQEIESSREIQIPSELEQYTVVSDFVELEKQVPPSRELLIRRRAVLKFLDVSEEEAATWRVRESFVTREVNEMSLEEQGDYLINRIAKDFCDWMRRLGGNEASSTSEETVKELFQVFMDNPGSRALSVQIREKKVLPRHLAEFYRVPGKSFRDALSKHLNWDARTEKKPSKLLAFGNALPNTSRFKTPKNQTAETWLEWNKLSEEEVSFADVYGPVKDLRSTKEYCKWMLDHPEYKRPQYLVDQGMFERGATEDPNSIRIPSDVRKFLESKTDSTDSSNVADVVEPVEVKCDKEELQCLVEHKLSNEV